MALTKNFYAGMVTISVSDFDNSGGTVTNLAGTLVLEYFVNTMAGAYYATSDATIVFSGGSSTNYLTPGNPLALDGGGQFEFASGYLKLTNNTIANLQLQGGALMLGANFQGGTITNLALDGITLANNTLPVTGIFNITNGATYGNFTVQNGGVLNEYDVSLSGSVTVAGGGVFTVNGVQINSDGSVTVAGGGMLNVGVGTLTSLGPLTNSGTINMTDYGISIYNDGTANARGGLLNGATGQIKIYGSAGIDGVYSQEYFINAGALTKSLSAGTASIDVSDFTNSGAITSQEGTLQLNKVTLKSSGSLGVRLNGATDYGKLSISGAAVLTGAFDVTLNGNYVPDGTVFNVLSYGSASGNFNLFLPALVPWTPQYNSTAFTLAVALRPLTVTLSGNNFIFNATGGSSGNQGVLLTSTNLTQPLAQWTPVVTNALDSNGHFNFTNSVGAGKPRQFFILKFQ